MHAKVKFFVYLFVTKPNDTQGLLLPLLSGIIPGRFTGPYGVLGIEPGLVICKANALCTVVPAQGDSFDPQHRMVPLTLQGIRHEHC